MQDFFFWISAFQKSAMIVKMSILTFALFSELKNLSDSSFSFSMFFFGVRVNAVRATGEGVVANTQNHPPEAMVTSYERISAIVITCSMNRKLRSAMRAVKQWAIIEVL